jgi:L-lactate dehydrogenase (cytochrome)
MARDKWFETVAVAQERAKKRLPKAVYSALLAGSEKGLTYSDNVEAYAELGFAPHVIGATEKRDLSTTVMGQDISMPVVISPTGVQAVHPDGEVAVARAAAARGTAMGLSSFASKPIEEVVAVNPKTFFQIYWLGGRDAIAERAERARAAGAVGLIATTDWSFSHGRDWGSPKIPEKMDMLTAIKMSPQGIVRPSWFLEWAKTLRPPTLTAPNQGSRGEAGPPFFAAYGEWMGTPPPTWEDIAWLREFWGGPFMLKGVMRVDDAKRAVRILGEGGQARGEQAHRGERKKKSTEAHDAGSLEAGHAATAASRSICKAPSLSIGISSRPNSVVSAIGSKPRIRKDVTPRR